MMLESYSRVNSLANSRKSKKAKVADAGEVGKGDNVR